MNARTLIKLFESGDYGEFLRSLERVSDSDTVSLYAACGLLAARRHELVDALIQQGGLMQIVYVVHDELDARIQRELDECRYTALQVTAETALYEHPDDPLRWFVAEYRGRLSPQDYIFTQNTIIGLVQNR